MTIESEARKANLSARIGPFLGRRGIEIDNSLLDGPVESDVTFLQQIENLFDHHPKARTITAVIKEAILKSRVNVGLGEKRETRRYDPADLAAFRAARKAVAGKSPTVRQPRSVIDGSDFQARLDARRNAKLKRKST